MSKIALMCDSSADITEQEAKELDIHVLRMPIVIKDKEYIEGVNIDDSMIIKALNNNESVKRHNHCLGIWSKCGMIYWKHMMKFSTYL